MTDRHEMMLSSELVFDGKLIALKRDKVQLPDGRRTIREIVVHPGGVVILPLLDDGRVVLVRQFRYAVGETLIELPAGALNSNEEPEKCALRELQEETGYTASSLEKLISFYPAPGYSTELLHAFLATGLQKAGSDMDENELIETVLMPLEEAIVMAMDGTIKDAKSITVLLWVWHKFKRQ